MLCAVVMRSHSVMTWSRDVVLGFLHSQALGSVATWCWLTQREREWFVPCHMALLAQTLGQHWELPSSAPSALP